MTTLKTSEIVTLTGMSRSRVAYHLARFPEARVRRGRYDSTSQGLAAWLESAEVSAPSPAHKTTPDFRSHTRSAPLVLPSGILIAWPAWHALRGSDESRALFALDWLIQTWKLPPHDLVPDHLPYKSLTLESGTPINRSQFRILRGANDRRSAEALDVLIRSFAQ